MNVEIERVSFNENCTAVLMGMMPQALALLIRTPQAVNVGGLFLFS